MQSVVEVCRLEVALLRRQRGFRDAWLEARFMPARYLRLGLLVMQAPAVTAADHCFAHPDVAELTIEWATDRASA